MDSTAVRRHGKMGETMKFDYYYGIEAEQFSFYRVPRLLIKDERFKGLSSDAKLLYGLMLDGWSLSMKNGWLDEENRAYIIYMVSDTKPEEMPVDADESTEVQKLAPNYTNYNHTDKNYTDMSYINSIHQSERNAYIELIKENIEYDHHMQYDSRQNKEVQHDMYGGC
jgi:hypothetical protein